LAALGGSSGASLGLLHLRYAWSGTNQYFFLEWNLFLAAIPFVLALAIEFAAAHRLRALLAPLIAVWLVFLPNAPYIVTDFVHLGTGAPIPLWFDAILFSSFAATGLGFGLASIALLRRLGSRYRHPVTVWVAVALVLTASSFGIFLGRFEAFNSWDLLVRPIAVIHQAISVGDLGQASRFTVAFTLFLLVTYLAFERLLTANRRHGLAVRRAGDTARLESVGARASDVVPQRADVGRRSSKKTTLFTRTRHALNAATDRSTWHVADQVHSGEVSRREHNCAGGDDQFGRRKRSQPAFDAGGARCTLRGGTGCDPSEDDLGLAGGAPSGRR
jgi:uncharacterized membrane protein